MSVYRAVQNQKEKIMLQLTVDAVLRMKEKRI